MMLLSRNRTKARGVFFSIGFIMGLMVAGPASAQTAQKWPNAEVFVAHLNSLFANGEHQQVLEELSAFPSQPNGPALYERTIKWVDDALFKKAAPSDYLSVHIPLIWLARDNPVWFRELAARMYWFGYIRKRDMAARCAEPPFGPMGNQNFEAQSAPMIAWFRTLPMEVRVKLVEVGIEIAENAPTSEFDERVCMNSAAYAKDYLAKHHGATFEETQPDPETGQKVGVFAAESFPDDINKIDYDPELIEWVDDEECQHRKSAIRREAIESQSR